MYKYLSLTALLLSGCAEITINGTMCDQIATEPNTQMPQECRNYNEKEADKAFHKVIEEKKVSDDDIKFDNKDDE
jgi:hypothetical protein